jgi:hypothetical protein
MELIELFDMLEVPTEVQEQLKNCERIISIKEIKNEIEKMKYPEYWEIALEHLKHLLEPDENGMKILACQLYSVCNTYDEYVRIGISQKVFIDTMKFFTRFLKEYKNRFGFYRYTWAWWAVRQISMLEYRIGELEYEMKFENGEKYIDIHIPADTDMSTGKLRESYCDALVFFNKYYPEFSNAEMVCSSWLLAPSLKKVMPENSKILQFQKSFTINHMDAESIAFMDWVYGSRDIPIKDLPENTSLQKRLKPYLLSNGKIEWASGKLVANPFLAE